MVTKVLNTVRLFYFVSVLRSLGGLNCGNYTADMNLAVRNAGNVQEICAVWPRLFARVISRAKANVPLSRTRRIRPRRLVQ